MVKCYLQGFPKVFTLHLVIGSNKNKKWNDFLGAVNGYNTWSSDSLVAILKLPPKIHLYYVSLSILAVQKSIGDKI